jgi:hypothetical protein
MGVWFEEREVMAKENSVKLQFILFGIKRTTL